MTDSETLGPLVTVTLPDGQQLSCRLHIRRQETDRTWWYTVSTDLWSKVDRSGRHTGEPAPAVFDAPAKHCSPIDGQDYAGVPTERAWEPPAWVIERRSAGLQDGVHLVLHRAGCRAGGPQRLQVHTPQARTARDDGAELCPVCAPRP